MNYEKIEKCDFLKNIYFFKKKEILMTEKNFPDLEFMN